MFRFTELKRIFFSLYTYNEWNVGFLMVNVKYRVRNHAPVKDQK